jgi:hypothetical protein
VTPDLGAEKPPEPPRRVEITTIAELVELTTVENVEEMIENVTQMLLLTAGMKAAGQAVKLNRLTWVDDGQRGISHVGLNLA